MPRKPIYDTEMTERLYMRVTAEQKKKWAVAPEYTAVKTSEFWRELFEMLSGWIVAYYEGDISPRQFEDAVGGDVRRWVDEVRLYVRDSVQVNESVKVEIEDEGET